MGRFVNLFVLVLFFISSLAAMVLVHDKGDPPGAPQKLPSPWKKHPAKGPPGKPANDRAGYFTAKFLFLAGYHEFAEVRVQDYLDRFPDSPDGLYLKGLVAYEERRYAPAMKLLTQAARSSETFFDANEGETILALGRAHYRAEMFQGAKKYLEAAAGLLNDSSCARFQFGLILFRNGHREEAAAAYLAALEIDSDWRDASPADALYNLAVIARWEDDHEKAAGFLEKTLDMNPNNRRARIWLSNTYYEMSLSAYQDNKMKSSRFLARKALDVWPDNDAAKRLLSFLKKRH